MHSLDLAAIDQLISLYGSETSADYVGNTWTDASFTATLGEIRQMLASSRTWGQPYDTTGMQVVQMADRHWLVDGDGDVVLMITG